MNPQIDWIPFLIGVAFAIIGYALWVFKKNKEYKRFLEEKKMQERYEQEERKGGD